jgi:hypothetical protein
VHHAMGQFMTHEEWDKWLMSVPEDARMYHLGGDFHLCRANSSQ